MSVLSEYLKRLPHPHYRDAEHFRVAGILYAIASATLVALFVLVLYRALTDQLEHSFPFLVIFVVISASLILVRRGLIDLSSSLILWSLLAFLSFQCYQNDGLQDTAVFAYPGLLVIAGLVLTRRYYIVFAVASLLTILALGYLEIRGFITARHDRTATYRDIVDLEIILSLTAITVRVLADNLIGSLRKGRAIEKELREQAINLSVSEERYRVLFESAGDAIFILSGDAIVDCNAKAVSMFGGEKNEQIIGLAPWRFSPPSQPDGTDSEKKARSIIKDAQQGTPQSFYWKCTRLGGTSFDADISMSRLEYGRGVLVQALVRDITVRKRIEDTLRKLTRAVEQSPVSIVITDTSGAIEYVNPKFTGLTGYTLEEVVGQNPRILKSGLLPDAQYRDLWSTIKSGNVWRGDLCNKKKNGELYWERASISPVTNDDGEITHFVAVKEDITQKREAERTLQESEELHRKLITTVPDLIIRTDLDGNIVFINETMFQTSSFATNERILGKNMYSFIAEEERPRAYDNAKQMLDGRLGPREYTLKFEGDLTLNCEVNGDVLRSSEGAAYGMVYVIRDITERKRAEEKRKALELQLFQAQRIESIGTLASGIAHDFNNILHIILGNVALVSNVPGIDEKTARRIKAIENASDRGAKLVKQLMKFARKTGIEVKSLAINELIREMAILLEETLPKSIAVTLDLKQDTPMVVGDVNQLHQVLMNLCLNARDAMPKGGRLSIVTRSVPGSLVKAKFPNAMAQHYAMTSVTDSGCGMDDAILKKIFDPFFTTKEDGKGTGLGLAVVHGIVENHGGFIEARSVPGRGAEFNVYFPGNGHAEGVIDKMVE